MKDVLVGIGEPVLDAGGHGVRLPPDYIIAECPSIVNQTEGYPPGNAHQALCGQIPRACRLLVVCYHLLFAETRCLVPMMSQHTRICVANVEIEASVFCENSANLLTYTREILDVFLVSWLKAKLSIHSIISESPEGRARYHEIDRVRPNFSQLFKSVTNNELVPRDRIT